MADSSQNVRAVQQIYADFGSGNIPGILAQLANDVVWNEPEAGPPPFGGSHRGLEAVAQFFQQLGETAVPEHFEPRDYLAQGDTVVALGSYRFRAKTTGRSWSTEWAMRWTFRDGKVAHFRIYKDSAAEAAALQA